MNKKLVVSVLVVISLLVGISIFSVATAEYSPTPTPTLTPSPSPTPTPSFSETIAEEHKKYPKGLMVFNTPENMTIGKKERIEVRIIRNNTAENLTEGLKGRGVPQVKKIKAGRYMSVRLKGDNNFDIEPLFIDEKNIVGSEEPAEWAWDVTPLELGVQELHLLSRVLVVTRWGVFGKDNRVRDKPIYVTPSFKPTPTTTPTPSLSEIIDEEKVDGSSTPCKNFIKKYWQWIISVIIAIIALSPPTFTRVTLRIIRRIKTLIRRSKKEVEVKEKKL